MKPTSKILVGVTQRVDCVSGRVEIRDALDQKLLEWLIHCGFIPVPIPNILIGSECRKQDKEGALLEEWLEVVEPNAILISGGNDIGEHPNRDITEQYLLSWAKEKRLSVLSICRGMQVMATWAGAKLVKVEGHVKTRHNLTIPGEADEWPARVNSYHNWGLSDCPTGFEITAQAEGDSIEAIRHLELPWEGWMWHPERETPFSTRDTLRVRKLFSGRHTRFGGC